MRRPAFAILGLSALLLTAAPAAAEPETGPEPETGRGVAAYLRGDHSQAHELLLPAAREGAPDAAYVVGLLELRGCGVDSDVESGRDWLRRAAEAGQAQARAALDRLARAGAAPARHCFASPDWYRAAAEAGDNHARFQLAQLYLRGHGVERAPREAARWLGLAAAGGLPLAQANLGALYANGVGVPRDDIHAYLWLHLAAKSLPPEDGRALARRNRAIVADRMSFEDLRQAHGMIRQWVPGQE